MTEKTADTPTLEINPENHAQFNCDPDRYPSWHKTFKKCLDANLSLNEYLDAHLGKAVDWGAHYNTFLKNIGITPNSEEGWWSIDAVRRENIEAFIQYHTTDITEDIVTDYDDARVLWDRLDPLFKQHNMHTVTEVITAFKKIRNGDI